MARRLCRAVLESNPMLGAAGVNALTDAATFAAVERVARSDRRVAATADLWDADTWLLNTPAGTVDLRTGTMREHRREDCITKSTAVAPAAEADCPIWRAFLARVTDNDGSLQEYLQRLCGYCLTGSIIEHIFAFFYGTGANGKGTFLNTQTGLLGDYAAIAPAEVFQSSKTDRHPTELAMLRGARLVTAQETEEGRIWAESRIKALTGGDPVTARFMRADFFTFAPTFKLMIAGNHKPGLKSVDEAIRRRLHLVPFEVQIPAGERDKSLADKLKAEWPGILRWMIDGGLKWQADGLRPPAAVQDATEAYFEATDTFGAWLAECTERSDVAWQRENTADLFGSWKSWAERAGEHPGTSRTFAEAMERHGFAKKREAGTGRMGFAGIRLKRHDYTECERTGG